MTQNTESVPPLCARPETLLFPLAQWLETLSHMFKLYFEQFRKIFFFIRPGSADHASRNQFWRESSHLGSSTSIIRLNYIGQITVRWIVCIKARNQQNYPGNNVGEAGSDQARKKAGEQLHPARSTSAILKVRNFINRPDSWPRRPLHNHQANYQAESGGESAIQAQNSSPVGQDGGSTAGKRFPSSHASHPQEMENIVSIDEAWCYRSHVNGRRKMYCRFHGKKNPESWRKICVQKRSRGIMFVTGISPFGLTVICFVPPDAKVNANFYINKVLKPIFEKDIPRLFGKDASHTAGATVRWLENFSHSFIPTQDWPTSSFDLSPMDCSVNGIFKLRLWKEKARSVKGLKRGHGPRMVKSDCWSLCWNPFCLGIRCETYDSEPWPWGWTLEVIFFIYFAGWKKTE